MSTMHLDLGLAQTINRATHVTRGFRHIVMVTATGELSSALAQGMADAPLRRIQQESAAKVLADHAAAKISEAWLDLMFNVVRSRR